MVQQPAEARSLNGVEAPQLSRDAVHEPFMFVLKTKILQDSPRRCLKGSFKIFRILDEPVLLREQCVAAYPTRKVLLVVK